jgi:hypothetical protein
VARGGVMPTTIVSSPGSRVGTQTTDPQTVDRSLRAAYARPRIEELVRAVLEDALSPSRLDETPWDDDVAFEAELTAAVGDIADVTTDLVGERLASLLETAPQRPVGSLAAGPRYMDHP